MPELPEVETVRRALAPVLEGRSIVAASVGRDRTARRNQKVSDVVDRLVGRRVGRVGRHGKFLLIEVSEDLTWVIHLGMSGRISVTLPNEEDEPHTHFRATTDAGLEVRFIDPRTFGFVAVLTPQERSSSGIDSLGPDAFSEEVFSAGIANTLTRRRAPIKAQLLDQRVIAGLGNIYVDEVLHRAGIAPTRSGSSLSESEVATLLAAVRPVLEDGIRFGGTSLNDLAYLLPDGRAGEYLDRLAVYGRTDQPCRRCGTPIVRTVIAQRSAHYCPRCQV